MTEISYFKHFECDIDDPSVGPKWSEWLEDLELYLAFVNITNDDRKKAALLHHAGTNITKMYRTVQQNPLPDPTAAEGDTNIRPVDAYADVKRKLTAYFNPKRNAFFEKHTFRQARQLAGETLDNYATRLRQLSQYCEFGNINQEIILQIIEGGIETSIASKALRTTDITLEALLDWGRVRSITNSQVSEIKRAENANTVNAIQHATFKRKAFLSKSEHKAADRVPSTSRRACGNCGNANDSSHSLHCPASGKTCKTCGKLNHFAKVCRSALKNKHENRATFEQKHVNKIDEQTTVEAEDDKVFLFAVSTKGGILPRTSAKISGTDTTSLIDTGSSVVSNLFFQAYK